MTFDAWDGEWAWPAQLPTALNAAGKRLAVTYKMDRTVLYTVPVWAVQLALRLQKLVPTNLEANTTDHHVKARTVMRWCSEGESPAERARAVIAVLESEGPAGLTAAWALLPEDYAQAALGRAARKRQRSCTATSARRR